MAEARWAHFKTPFKESEKMHIGQWGNYDDYHDLSLTYQWGYETIFEWEY